MPTTEEIQAVKDTGICCEQPLTWVRFMDGTGVATPVAKAKGICAVCLTEYVKTVRVVDLDEV